MTDNFYLVGSRPSSAASNHGNYNDYPSKTTSYTSGQLKHQRYADKLFGKLTVAKEISERSPSKNVLHKNCGSSSVKKGPMKGNVTVHKASYVDEMLFGNGVKEADFLAPWDKGNMTNPVAFDCTDYTTTPRHASPRPTSARKKNTYKSQGKTSYIDETLFGTSNPHLTTNYVSLEVDTNKCKLPTGDESARSNGLDSFRPPSGRYSSHDSRPPSRTCIGEDPIHKTRTPLRPQSRSGSAKVRHNPSYIDETLFGPKLSEPDFSAPWEKPEDRNKPRPYFCDSTNYSKTIYHEQEDKPKPKSKTRPTSAKNLAERPVWK